MIGGYLYSRVDESIERCLQNELNELFEKIRMGGNGYLFFDNPYQENHKPYSSLDDLVVLSQDFLVATNSDGECRALNIQRDFSVLFRKRGISALNDVVSDFRMVVVEKSKKQKTVFLVSNRAGSGRIFYHRLTSGILFSSDLRFLLRIVRFDVNTTGIYSILKYGAIPEPMTISKNLSAVPAAHYVKYDLTNNDYSTQPYFKFQFDYSDNESSPKTDDTILDPARNILQKSAGFLNGYQPAILMSGGIDSSLYACYLNERAGNRLKGFYCTFDENDPELKFAKSIAERTNADFHIAWMKNEEAVSILDEVVQLTDHPFADFSSMPTGFVLKYVKQHMTGQAMVIECNGGDDCFGFPGLDLQAKYAVKHYFPNFLKRIIVDLFKNSSYWKWESHEGPLARLAALADVHEIDALNYLLVQTPLNYLGMDVPPEWDMKLARIMESVFSSCGAGYEKLDYRAKTTIRQLMHINSRQWTAKALSAGESLGLRVIYPYIWRDVLVEQGKLPWNVKIHNGIVKWPLKKLLEEFMPREFIYRQKSGFVPPFAKWLNDKPFNYKVRDILLAGNGHVTEIVPPRILDELLSDALNGKRLRFPVLNFLWGAIFTEMWIQYYKSPQ